MDWAQGLPLGILFFASTAFGAWWRRKGRSTAQKHYPALAEKFGLRFEPPRHAHWAGRLHGTWAGYEVLIESEERARVVVRPKRPIQIDLRSYMQWKRAPQDMVPFSLSNRKLVLWLPNRYCAPLVAEQLHGNTEIEAALVELWRYRESLRQFSIDSERLECVFQVGAQSYVPARDVEPLLTLTTTLLRAIEQCYSVVE